LEAAALRYFNAVKLLEEKFCGRLDRAVSQKRVGRRRPGNRGRRTTTLTNWMNADRHWTFSGPA